MDADFQAEWEQDCLRYGDRVLTGKYQHWCPDWDGLPIDDTVSEFDCCTCPKEEPSKCPSLD